MNPHLFVDISSHGFGHLAQTAPVLAELRRRLPNLRLTVRCGLAKRMLLTRIAEPFIHIRECSDFGYVQRDAVSIDHDASRRAYAEAHADWAGAVVREADFLRRLRPDLVLANAAYLPLAGAAAAGLPALGMSSLTWQALARHFYGGEAWAAPVLAQMAAAYAAAPFIALTPAMDGLPAGRQVGPVARLGDPAARARLRREWGVAAEDRVVLVAMGGFALDLPLERWPERPGLRYLLPESWDCSHASALHYSQTEQDFAELLQAADAVLTKPGYGTFTEAACNGTPLLYVRREDWPEQEALIAWLQVAGRCREVDRAALDGADWLADLAQLLAQPPRPCPVPTGIAEAAEVLLERLQVQAEA
ncbi:hypothetical protein DLREEDagrD3_13930 [Denitratisoma sp. agr-D3]